MVVVYRSADKTVVNGENNFFRIILENFTDLMNDFNDK